MIPERNILVFLGFFILTLSALPAIAFCEGPSIVLPLSSPTDSPVTIDGVWTSPDEWRKASATIVNYTDGTHLVLRGIHDSSSLYILLEMPQEYTLDGRAAVCFDTLNDGGPYMKPDDYCFLMGDNILKEYHGDGRTTVMQQTGLNPGVEASSGLSNENTPHESDRSHVAYEFKVPIEYLGESNKDFGFYVTFETRGQVTHYTYYYSWPDYKTAASLRVASPRDWGHLEISSDTVVPEFPFPVIGIIAGLVGVAAVLTREKFLRA